MGDQASKSEGSGDLPVWKWFIGGAVAVLALTAGYLLTLRHIYSKGEERGLFGDMFGGLNTVFSGLAFLGLVLAIFLQQNELKKQQEELTLAREAHQSTAAAMQTQIENAERVAEIGGLNLLITIERERLAMSTDPGTIGEVGKRKRMLRRLETFEQRLEALVSQDRGAANV